MLAATGFMFKTTPGGFVPDEDQGFFAVNIQLPDAASLNRTEALMSQVSDIIRSEPGVESVITVSGFSILGGGGSNAAMAIAVLKPWAERSSSALHQDAIMQRAQMKLWGIKEAQIIAFGFPPIPGLGSSGGFDFRLQDTMGRSPQELAQVLKGLVYKANQQPELTRVYSTWQANVPQYFLDVNRDKAAAQDVPLADIFLTLQTQLGSLYVNDFPLFGKNYRVNLQSESADRSDPFGSQQILCA